MTNLNAKNEENYSDEYESSNEKEQAANNSLDAYINTGVYIEENKEHGDILIVFGSDVLDAYSRQFYLSEENKLFTRVCLNNDWSSWFVIQPNQNEETVINFNNFNEPNLITINNHENHKNAPKDFSIIKQDNVKSMLICMSVEDEHLIQFLIGADKRNFWIRHSKNQMWNEWERFI